MACSKFFSGDLPELINEIIQYFHYDYKTLHSCILVNRLWCRLTIPLLCEDPFSIKSPENYYFIEICLCNLNENDKTKLNEYGNYNDLFSSNTLFNYPSFIRHLDTHKIYNSIEKWVLNVGIYFITDSSTSQISNLTKLIYRLLFLIFIENEANLHSFEVTLLNNAEYECFDEVFELILQNPNFICNIKSFKLDLSKTTDNIINFLGFLYSYCNSITSLYLFPLYTRDYYPIFKNNLSQIIKSQENLKKILFTCDFSQLHYSFLSLKSPNYSNTLNTIIFYIVDFKDVTVLSEAFNQLNVLESVHIVYCYSLDSKFFQQIDNITKPFKLKSLFLDEELHIESLKLLMQKSGNYLENFGNKGNRSQQLLQSIIKYCSKIKYLGSIRLDNQSTYLLFNLIENIKQNLNYLIINDFQYSDVDHLAPIILQNLGQILPFKLEYLCLGFKINKSDFEVFLKNSQNTFIKRLLISNTKKEESENIFPYIKEYIMRKKRVKYLAILEYFHGKREDLFSLKDEVKEFESYDIQVVNYRDLIINVYDFIKEA
jgi:hypothetical protein